MVSHELRTPLNAIVGWAHLLQSGGLDADRIRRAAETIVRNAKLQSQLISDILDVQSLTSGKLRLDIGEIDLNLALEAALESLRPAAAAKHISLTPLLDASSRFVQGDSDRLQQVIWNLLSNAIKFTPVGGTVSVLLGHGESYVEISVRDCGPGIRPDFLPYVFERFRQDAPTGGRPAGLGLGLAIVRQLVELHGGSVQALNREDGPGAVFTVQLPRLPRAQASAVAGGTAEILGASAPADAPPSLRDLRILVVDDEPDAREVVAAVLGQYGGDVTLAGSGEEALRLLVRVRPHVLVSDIGMPDQDGYALLRTIRALPVSQGGLTPALALTAAATTEDRLRTLRAGYQLHLPKPVQPTELAQAIFRLAGGSRA
jgi:CheY-like chemotaxis protein